LKADSQDDESGKVLREGLSDGTVNLIVQTIRDTILGGEDEIELFSTLLKEDLLKASGKGDVDFINKVIVPILHAEEKIPITISTFEGAASSALQPIFAGAEA
jgi:hypothetical protein